MSTPSVAMTGKERQRKFRENNRERSRQLAREWYWRNREKAIEASVECNKKRRERQKKLDEEQKVEIERLQKLVHSLTNKEENLPTAH
nr:hypothetical protein MarFTME_510 [Marseillevirus futianmevirus]